MKVYERLTVGAQDLCSIGSADQVIVHACKSPCHQRAVGYRGSLHDDHPHYLVYEDEFELYLNIIDPPVPLFKPKLFTAFLIFAGQHWDAGREVIIHCNQGESRSPTLAMMLLAKHLGQVSDSSFQNARQEFESMYLAYRPGAGIQTYLRENWHEF